MSLELNYETDSKVISFSEFCINSLKEPSTFSEVAYHFPKFQIITNALNNPVGFIHFSLVEEDFQQFKDSGKQIHHIAEYLDNFEIDPVYYSGKILYIYIASQVAFIFAKRINDYILSRIVHFETAEDVLYHLEFSFQSLNMSRDTDRVILGGSVTLESKIAKLISVYYPNLKITDLTLSSLSNS